MAEISEKNCSISGLDNKTYASIPMGLPTAIGLSRTFNERQSTIRGGQEALSERDSYIDAISPDVSIRDALIHGISTILDDRKALVVGGTRTFGDVSARIYGAVRILDDRPVTIKGSVITNSERMGYIHGVATIVTDRDATVSGIETTPSEINALIHGVATIIEERDATIFGAVGSALSDTVFIDDDLLEVSQINVTRPSDTINVEDNIEITIVKGLTINNLKLPFPNKFRERFIEDGIIHQLISGNKKWDLSYIIRSFELTYDYAKVDENIWRQIENIYEEHVKNGQEIYVYFVWGRIGFEGYCLLDISPVSYKPGTDKLASLRLVLTEMRV